MSVWPLIWVRPKSRSISFLCKSKRRARLDSCCSWLARTYGWFEEHSGWAPPDADTLAEWLADGVCRSPDECLVAPDGCCEHGLVSWAIVIDELEAFDRGGVSMRAVTSAADPPTSEPIVHDVPDQERIVGQDFIGEAIHQRLFDFPLPVEIGGSQEVEQVGVFQRFGGTTALCHRQRRFGGRRA